MNRWAPQLAIATIVAACAFVGWTLRSISRGVRWPRG